jgi:hypothetical protein
MDILAWVIDGSRRAWIRRSSAGRPGAAGLDGCATGPAANLKIGMPAVDACLVAMTVLSPPPTLPAASPAVLWREYRRTGDRRLRDRLVFTLAPLVRHAGAGDPLQAEAGLTALVAAVDEYAPERHGALERYAWSRVCAVLASRA